MERYNGPNSVKIPQSIKSSMPLVSFMIADAVRCVMPIHGGVGEVSIQRSDHGGFEVYAESVDRQGAILGACNGVNLPQSARLKDLRRIVGTLPTEMSLRVAKVLGWE